MIAPQPGPQTKFLTSPADIVIYGGAAGGGKSYGLLLEPLRHIHNPDFNGVIFRQSYPQITLVGGLWDEAEKIYPLAGGKPNKTNLEYEFPAGPRLKFAHVGSDSDLDNYYGAQIVFIGWDQLELHSEKQFFYMLSRNRSVSGIRPYVRATVNPDADSWLAKFLEWWIDQDTGYPIKERGGLIRWFVRADELIVWADTKEELLAKFDNDPELSPKSLTFIPSSVYDNKILLKHDPAYLANLKALPLVERERLLYGNWKIKPAAGKVFNRGWFEIVNAIPAGPGGIEVRFWDFAATEEQKAGDDPDYTASTKIRLVNGIYYVMDSTADRMNPADTDRMFVNLSWQDYRNAAKQGIRYAVAWETEKGAAGKRDTARLKQMIAGMPCAGRPPEGDKLTRSKALASQAEAGNVKLLAGDWNERWLTHMHHQPDWGHDDEHDSSAGAFNELARAMIPQSAQSRRG